MNYIDWHYFEVWPKIITLWRNTILFAYYYFSIPLHLKTLFSPWHRQKVKMRVGFHLDDFFGVLSFNVISRILGAIVRTSTIFYGLVFMLLSTVFWVIPAVVWPVIPGLTLPVYWGRKPEKGKEAQHYLSISNGNMNKLIHLLFEDPQGKFIYRHLGLDINNMPSVITAPFPDPRNNISTMPQLFKTLFENYKPIKSDDVFQTALWYEKLYEKRTTSLFGI
ncbi:MAG: hypothetical protein PHV59_12080 [Victivallales bacterium]|nr:hypothetical protein [Victivallales bacterium]